mgnify:CR=1 FL=1
MAPNVLHFPYDVVIDGRTLAGLPGGVPTIGIWGEWNTADSGYNRRGNTNAQIGPDPADNFYFGTKSHTETATSAEAFAVMYEFLTGHVPDPAQEPDPGKRAALERALAVVRDVMRGAVTWSPDPDPVERTMRGVVAATAESEHVRSHVLTAPLQALARLHTAAAGGLLDDALLGRPRAAGEDCLELTDLGMCIFSLFAIACGVFYQKKFCDQTRLLRGTLMQYVAGAIATIVNTRRMPRPSAPSRLACPTRSTQRCQSRRSVR